MGGWERNGLCFLYTQARWRSAAQYLHVDRVFQAMWFLRLGHCMRLLREDQFGDVPGLTSPRAAPASWRVNQYRRSNSGPPQFAGQRALKSYITIIICLQCEHLLVLTHVTLTSAMLWSGDLSARRPGQLATSQVLTTYDKSIR